jgi:hypothetical protein
MIYTLSLPDVFLLGTTIRLLLLYLLTQRQQLTCNGYPYYNTSPSIHNLNGATPASDGCTLDGRLSK